MSFYIKEVNTSEVVMRYLTFGTGSKPLVIIPGLSVKSVLEAAKQIELAYSDFAKDYTVYLFDRRSNIPKDYAIAQMAEDTVKVLKKLRLKNICFFGASQGGMIAMQIALTHPELTEKLALCSTSAEITEKEAVLIGGWSSLAREGKAKELFLSFGKAVYPESVFSLFEDFLIKESETVNEEELGRFATLCNAVKGFNVLEKLESITCPIMLTGAEDDAVLGLESTKKIIKKLDGKPNFRYFIYPPGYGHACYDTAPDYKKRLKEFFNR